MQFRTLLPDLSGISIADLRPEAPDVLVRIVGLKENETPVSRFQSYLADPEDPEPQVES